MWNFIISLNFFIRGFWCVVGDINVVLKDEDRIYGLLVLEVEIKDFKEFMDICMFDDMKVIGRYYIWLNGYVSSKIDRVFCNFDWIIIYGMICVDYKENVCFDYFFIVMFFLLI